MSFWHLLFFQSILCSLAHDSLTCPFLRESDFLRDFLDGHNCWDCTTSRRLYARTVLRSRKVSPMFAGRNSLIRPDGCLDMVPSSIFVTIFWESLSKNSEISQKIVKFEAPVVYKCADLWTHRPAEDIQDTCMLNRKRKYLILPTIYALYDADFVFERLSQKIMKSLKKQSSSRGRPFTSAPTSGVTDPRKTFRTHVCSTEKESI